MKFILTLKCKVLFILYFAGNVEFWICKSVTRNKKQLMIKSRLMKLERQKDTILITVKSYSDFYIPALCISKHFKIMRFFKRVLSIMNTITKNAKLWLAFQKESVVWCMDWLFRITKVIERVTALLLSPAGLGPTISLAIRVKISHNRIN